MSFSKTSQETLLSVQHAFVSNIICLTEDLVALAADLAKTSESLCNLGALGEGGKQIAHVKLDKSRLIRTFYLDDCQEV